MGNSQTREARSQAGSASQQASGSGTPTNRGETATAVESNGRNSSSRIQPGRRGSRSDIATFLGISGNNDLDVSSLEARRENKQERDARRAERERQVRLKERESSMREEHVDGGYLVTQGVYVGAEDFEKRIVRQLMIERRLAPFWRGLNEYSDSWAEHQLMAAARGMPIPPADEVPPELEYTIARKPSPNPSRDKSVMGQTIPMESRSQSAQSDTNQLSPGSSSFPHMTLPPTNAATSSSLPFRARAKTLASLGSASRTTSEKEISPREIQLPPDPFVNGQPIEVYLYKDAEECPICFLSYPPYLNMTRCCEQSICSECFVQIKRPDPHVPEHEQPDPNAPPVSEEQRQAQAEGQLISEVATCPYCKQPEFGITYTPPPFRRGLAYPTGSQPYQVRSAMSSQTSVSSAGLSPGPGRRRGMSLSATAPEVITTDKVRPDWASKLAAARAHVARRSAAASALHAAAYLMNDGSHRTAMGPLGRRLRRSTLEGGERLPEGQLSPAGVLPGGERAEGAHMLIAPPRGSSSRRNRMEELEEMMMMEAIRLSLAAEEERRKKEEKEAKKKAKKEEKEQKKAEKIARKNSSFGSGYEAVTMQRSRSDTSSFVPEENGTSSGKGKGVEYAEESSSSTAPMDSDNQPNRSLANNFSAHQDTSQESLPISFSSTGPATMPEPFKRSHLRQMSNASSASSSFQESAGTHFPGSSTPPNAESLFNFRSLAAMIGEDEKGENSVHLEHTGNAVQQGSLTHLSERGDPTVPSRGNDVPTTTVGQSDTTGASATSPTTSTRSTKSMANSSSPS